LTDCVDVDPVFSAKASPTAPVKAAVVFLAAAFCPVILHSALLFPPVTSSVLNGGILVEFLLVHLPRDSHASNAGVFPVLPDRHLFFLREKRIFLPSFFSNAWHWFQIALRVVSHVVLFLL